MDSLPRQSAQTSPTSTTGRCAPVAERHAGQGLAAGYLLQGDVQGHGVRPAIACLADDCGVTGYVANTARGVELHVESSREESLHRFAAGLLSALPRGARVTHVDSSDAVHVGFDEFVIRKTEPGERLDVTVPSDVAVCARCRDELHALDDRRRGYPLITCAACGPRYSILRSLPFERTATAMEQFPLCDGCHQEFSSLRNRRFHAETTACPACGPQLWLSPSPAVQTGASESPLHAVCSALLAGGVIAVKGIGGYQLICDATQPEAVRRIRAFKQRPSKPLAVMLLNLEDIEPPPAESARARISAPDNPIVILDRHRVRGVAAAVTGGFNSIGVMLPTTGVHLLIAEGTGRPLVVTSGNVDGEPMITDELEADAALRPLADLVVHHDRPIIHGIDDSVVRISGGRRRTVRCARGLAPHALPLHVPRPILAVGAHQKVAIALSNGCQTILGPYAGSMSSVAARDRFRLHVEELTALYRCEPEIIACDSHPDYFTTRWAESQNTQLVPVQHHHAHIVATMVEHRLTDRRVLGVAFDGTGYGSETEIWGGEFLIADVTQFRRVAHLAPFALPGGEAAVREPWRVALALMLSVGQEYHAPLRDRLTVEQGAERVEDVQRLIESGGGLRTTSAGRLFDAVAAMVLNHQTVTFDAEAAMRLESVCDPDETDAYPIALTRKGDTTQLHWHPLISAVLNDIHERVPPQRIAMRFHRALADGIAGVAAAWPELPVVVGGGCFQNRILSELVTERLAAHPAGVYLPSAIPPDDSGLAAGQLAVAAAVCGEGAGRRGGA